MLMKVSKKLYIYLGFSYRRIDGRFASVNNTFMGSKMSSSHVSAGISLEPII